MNSSEGPDRGEDRKVIVGRGGSENGGKEEEGMTGHIKHQPTITRHTWLGTPSKATAGRVNRIQGLGNGIRPDLLHLGIADLFSFGDAASLQLQRFSPSEKSVLADRARCSGIESIPSDGYRSW
ncbi:hypothetical protein C8R47DRAFT_1062893 [Mycena vitilis]|nr:hypothetical protein C8R47DRAFT_1062893 [Mycena vitilis]